MKKLPATPANHRLYVVGDIHGRVDLLSKIIDMIERNAARNPDKIKKLIFLGDYIDRGLHSNEVIERLTNGFAHNIEAIFLRGNHEAKMIELLNGDFSVSTSFLKYGGDATFASYGIQAFAKMDDKAVVKISKEFVQKVPPHHHAFLNDTKCSTTFGDYYFVHAGARPGTPLSEQSPVDQLWIRKDFMSSDYVFEKMVIHGHTISEKPDVKPNRIGIDTGAYATGQLTCLILDGTKRMMMQT